jgi:predicted phage-related endonuclease
MPVETIPIKSRDQWLALRKRYVTASDVPAILNLSGYDRTPLGVYLEKKEIALPPAENTAMRRGRWCEPAVFAALEEEFPSWEIRRAKVFLADDDARLGATPDGVAIDPNRPGFGVVQCKVISRPVFQSKWLDNPDTHEDDETAPARVPIDYTLQTLTEAMLAQGQAEVPVWAVCAALVLDTFGAFLRVLPVERHEGAEKKIRSEVAAWWAMADRNVMPAVDPTRDADVLKALYPQDDGTEIDLTGNADAQRYVDVHRICKAAEKQTKLELEQADTALKALMGEHAYAKVADGSTVSWKTQEVRGFTVAPRIQRVMRIREPK